MGEEMFSRLFIAFYILVVLLISGFAKGNPAFEEEGLTLPPLNPQCQNPFKP